MKKSARKDPPDEKAEDRLVYRKAGGEVLLIGTIHEPSKTFPKKEIERLKNAVEAQDEIFFESSRWLYMSTCRKQGWVKNKLIENVAFEHFGGRSSFLDDMRPMNYSEIMKKHGMRPYVFSALYALDQVFSAWSMGYSREEDILNKYRFTIDVIRKNCPSMLPQGNLEKGITAALSLTTNFESSFRTIEPLLELSGGFMDFFCGVRDVEVYGPLMADVVAKAPGKKGVVIGRRHIENLALVLEGRRISVREWPECIEMLGDEARAALKALINAITAS